MKRRIAVLCLLAFFLFSCTENKTEKQGLGNCEVVATKTKLSNTEVVSCDITKLKDTLNLPLSFLVENLEFVKLDSRDEALVGTRYATVTDNFILVRNDRQNPFKLFDKQGKFLTKIGTYGQGPNEYLNVYDEHLDDVNQTIYILPWQTDKLLRFKTNGDALPPIPLCHRVPKGKFFVDAKNETVSVFLLPFVDIPDVAWTQDFEGNMISSIPAGHLSVRPDFSNEVFASSNTDNFDCTLFTFFEQRPDSLYYYDVKNNKLTPKFTLDFKKQPWKIHSYRELPNHFVGDVTVEKKLSEHTSTTEVPAMYIVDKKTLKGTFYKLYNDFLGDMKMPVWVSFHDGYYVWNVEPSELEEKLKEHLKANKEMSEDVRNKLEKILKGIDVNDNNYIFYGKLKR